VEFDLVELVEINKDHEIVEGQPSWMYVVVVVVLEVGNQMEDRHLA
jgi:hypothetical protein